jgi:hypothetical protein
LQRLGGRLNTSRIMMMIAWTISSTPMTAQNVEDYVLHIVQAAQQPTEQRLVPALLRH